MHYLFVLLCVAVSFSLVDLKQIPMVSVDGYDYVTNELLVEIFKIITDLILTSESCFRIQLQF